MVLNFKNVALIRSEDICHIVVTRESADNIYIIFKVVISTIYSNIVTVVFESDTIIDEDISDLKVVLNNLEEVEAKRKKDVDNLFNLLELIMADEVRVDMELLNKYINKSDYIE